MNKKIFGIIFFCFLVILQGSFLRGDLPGYERTALISLYTSTHGDSWANKSGWKTPPLYSDGFAMPGTEGSWFGVTVDGHLAYENVTELNLNSNNLVGTIPAEFYTFAYVEVLCLKDNHLSGSIPPQLHSLTSLQWIDLSHNQLTGPIPWRLSELENLSILNLQENQLTGSIPLEFGEFKSLQRLLLAKNQLTGTIPSQLGFLSYLYTLDLSSNNLSGNIPAQLGNLSYLRWLYLQDNRLSGNIPPQLGNLASLDGLYLHYNRLEGSIPAQLGNLAMLTSLKLSQNKLSGSIPYQLGNLSKLLYLYLDENQLSGNIPSQLGNLGKLKYLSLHDNLFSGSIPSQLGNLGKINHFSLRNNQLSGSIPSQLGNLKELNYLALNNNQLSGSIPSQLGNLSQLSILYLSQNHLSGTVPLSFIQLNSMSSLDISNNCLSATDPLVVAWLNGKDPDWSTTQNLCSPAEIALNRTTLNFGVYNPELALPAQPVHIRNNGSGTLNWSASCNVTWLSVSPSSGIGEASIMVSVNPAGFAVGTYTGLIQITAPNASNSPQTITVLLHIYDKENTSPPFGEFATPLEGATSFNSIPVTGWALDDIGIASVKIYNGTTYIGDAVLVEGARPDVEAAFPDYPNNYLAGWGYMLLSNMLPDGGNGTYTLYAKATDIEGNEVTLGAKTITIDNAHAVKPFGAMDTPTQGGTASGREYVNYGWALTPMPNWIPQDGSTIHVIIDGVNQGHAGYNTLRSDIAALFPGYANTNNAGGYYYIDTTKLKNGLHTIVWTVEDSGGNSDGIGSRYFSVMNTGTSSDSSSLAGTYVTPNDESFGSEQRWVSANEADECLAEPIRIKELERVVLHLGDENFGNTTAHSFKGYLMVGEQLRELPIGSTLDSSRGIFYWQPGPGFVGTYHFVFINTENQDNDIKQNVIIQITPKQ